jgi:hypothetical protein
MRALVRALAAVALCAAVAGCRPKSTPFLEPINAADDAHLRRDGIAVRVDLKQLGERATLVIAPQLPVVAQRTLIERRGPDDYSWIGKIGDDGSAVLTVHGAQVTGVVRLGPDVYDIVALPDGGHKLVRLTHLPNTTDHSPRFKTIEGKPAAPVIPRPVGSPTPVIEVLVAYTKAAREQRSDIAAVAQTALTEANQVNRDSGADLELHLAGTIEIDEEEDPDLDTTLDWLATPGDHHFDEAQAARAAKHADVVVLAIKLQGAVLGTSAAVMADAATGFAVVNYRYMTTDFVLAHEVGHLLGLRHEPEADTANSPFPEGHGYRYTGKSGTRETIMATGCFSACQRVPRWSNPAIPIDGEPGGAAGHSNEALVLTQTAYTVSRFN